MTRPIEELIVGDSPAIRELRQCVLRFAPLSLNVVIMGPTGSGKELVAEALHRFSGRRGAFVSTNVCAIPHAMFESTMFGHRRGAFTGAIADARGLMSEAGGGTLFLDEMGDVDLGLQVKLLRALDAGAFRPVGAREDARSSFRTVVATNRDLPTLVGNGTFRGDLWYRLAGVVLRVPPLSARTEDIPRLASHFLRGCGFDSAILDLSGTRALMAVEWHGHVRELKHVVLLAAALGAGRCDGGAIAAALASTRSAVTQIEDQREERLRLLELLAVHDWRPSAVAAASGVHLATLYRRLERLGIRIQAARRAASILSPSTGI